jgi:hypothetical protein
MQLRFSNERVLYLRARLAQSVAVGMQVGNDALVDKVTPVLLLQREKAVRSRRQRRAAVPARGGS